MHMLCYFPWSYCSRFIQSNFLFFPIIILRAIEVFLNCSSDYLVGDFVSLRTSEFHSISKNSPLGFMIHLPVRYARLIYLCCRYSASTNINVANRRHTIQQQIICHVMSSKMAGMMSFQPWCIFFFKSWIALVTVYC